MSEGAGHPTERRARGSATLARLRRAPLAAIWTALRPHQWLKNLLVFVPALAAHEFGAELAASAVAFVSISLAASGAYVLNDIVDRDNDKAHPRKRFRPLASGALAPAAGVGLSVAFFLAAFVVALALPPGFLLILLGYVALTSLYSLALKQTLIVDIIVLACLYGVRLIAGGVASGVVLSPWLAVFSLFIFFGLAMVKRCGELVDCKRSGGTALAGRAYRVEDLPALFAMAAASTFVSILVLALYVNSDAVRAAYSHPERMWLICIPVTLWISRMLLLTHRGDMHDDPIVFAATDRTSLAAAVACIAIVVTSL
jgi:4-hydroxybenzoate polyprenyltransferase